MRKLTASVLMVSLAVAADDARGLDIVGCGVTVPRNETGVLQADLDCSNTGTFAVQLLRRTTLDLNGHFLVGGPITPTVVAVEDPVLGTGTSNFTILGPGVISGTAPDVSPAFSGNACVLFSGGRALITSATGLVEIFGCETGVRGTTDGQASGRLTLEQVEVHDNHLDGVSVRTLVASDVSAHHHLRGVGLAASRPSMRERPTSW